MMNENFENSQEEEPNMIYEKNEINNSNYKTFEFGAHFHYAELYEILLHIVNKSNSFHCQSLISNANPKPRKKTKDKEIKSRNFDLNNYVRNNNYFFDNHSNLTNLPRSKQKSNNKTSINQHAIIYGERLLNPFFNKNTHDKDVKNNNNIRTNNFKQTKENKKFSSTKSKKEAKSSSNPRKENKKQPKINKLPQQKSGIKAKSQNIFKKKVCTKISSVVVKRKAYSTSNSKTKHLKFPLSYGNGTKSNNTHNDNNNTISTVSCVRSLVMKKKINFLTTKTMKNNNKNLITLSKPKNSKTPSQNKVIVKSQKSRNIKTIINKTKVNHLQTYNNSKHQQKQKKKKMSNHKQILQNFYEKLINMQNNCLSNMAFSRSPSQKNKKAKKVEKQTTNINNKYLKYSSPSLKLKTTNYRDNNDTIKTQNNTTYNIKQTTPNVTVSIEVPFKQDNITSRNHNNSIKNQILTSSINKMKKQIEQLYNNLNFSYNIHLKKKKKIIHNTKTRSHNNTNINNSHSTLKKPLEDSEYNNNTVNRNSSFLQKKKNIPKYNNSRLSSIFQKDLLNKLANLTKYNYNNYCK